MEQIENKMLLDEYWKRDNTDWDEYYEQKGREADQRYLDKVEEELLND